MSATALRNIPRNGTVLTQVVGTPRSGSTLLATMIDAHSEAACLIEPFLAWLRSGKFDYNWNDLSLEGAERFRYWCPRKLIARLCRDSSLEVVAFKETFRTPRHPTFPSQYFLEGNYEEEGTDVTIAIVRDPRDTWSSVIRRHPNLEADESTLDELLDAWNELCFWIQTEDLPYIRYEDLVSNPEHVKTLLCILGLELEPRVLNPEGTRGFGDQKAQSGGQIDSSSIGKHKEHVKSDTIRRINSTCSEYMKTLGYAD